MRHYERKQKWCEFTVLDPLGLLWVMFRKVFFRITWEHKSKKKNPFFYGDDEKNNSNMKLLTLNDIKTMCEHAMEHKSGQSYKNNLFCPEVILLFQRWYNKKNPAGSAIKTQKKSGSLPPQLTPARVCASCGSWAELFDKKLLRWKDDVANCKFIFTLFDTYIGDIVYWAPTATLLRVLSKGFRVGSAHGSEDKLTQCANCAITMFRDKHNKAYIVNKQL